MLPPLCCMKHWLARRHACAGSTSMSDVGLSLENLFEGSDDD